MAVVLRTGWPKVVVSGMVVACFRWVECVVEREEGWHVGPTTVPYPLVGVGSEGGSVGGWGHVGGWGPPVGEGECMCALVHCRVLLAILNKLLLITLLP